MAKQILAIGPWIGEFSYELCWWAPRLRKIRKDQFPKHSVLCFSYEGREMLYQDFIDEYIPYDAKTRKEMGYPGAGFSGNYNTNEPQTQDPAAEEFMSQHLSSYKDFTKISPYNIKKYCGEGSMGRKDTLADFPYGNYVHLNAREDFKNNINNIIKNNLDNSRQTIALMARIRNRFVEEDSESLPKKTWVSLIEKIINVLNFNIILIGVPPDRGYPGSLDLKDTNLFANYPKNIFSLVSEERHSVEKQIAVLQATACSFYASSGAAHLPFFANTPMFCYTRTAELPRYKKGWIMKLTNNHKKNHLCALYNTGPEYSATSVDYLFDQFCNFYKEKVNGRIV